jgi:predicted kinase
MKVMVWSDSTPKRQIRAIAETATRELISARPAAGSFSPQFIRIAGQSGSGKSTQVLPAVSAAAAYDKFISLSVADFVRFHPGGVTEREAVNGFCLRVLTEVLYKLVAEKVNIILDMTLLNKRYEKRLHHKLQKHNYELLYLVLAVPKHQSDEFIAKRKSETGRVVSNKSAGFFYNCLFPSLKLLSKRAPDANCVMWSAYDLEPIFNGKIADAPPPFIAARQDIRCLHHGRNKLLAAKTDFMKNYMDTSGK